MKIPCTCGNLIPDSNDFLPYKARFISDQDYYDMISALEAEFNRLLDAARSDSADLENLTMSVPFSLSHTVGEHIKGYIYECSRCGRLYIAADYSLKELVPAEEAKLGKLLRSVRGDNWKGVLSGNWSEKPFPKSKGNLMWRTNQGEGWEHFDNWEQFKQRYFTVFKELRDKDILRSAFLRREDEIVHDWPPKSDTSSS